MYDKLQNIYDYIRLQHLLYKHGAKTVQECFNKLAPNHYSHHSDIAFLFKFGAKVEKGSYNVYTYFLQKAHKEDVVPFLEAHAEDIDYMRHTTSRYNIGDFQYLRNNRYQSKDGKTTKMNKLLPNLLCILKTS
jgi:hypothetical protein